MRRGIDFRDDDVYWNMGDPGWAGGLYYAVLGPLLLGSTIIFCDGPFDAGQVYRVLLKYGVTNLQGPPHWYRTLREADRETPPPTGLRLRVVSSMGEPLPGEIVAWARERLGVALLNHYGQAELGVVICEQQAAAEGVEGGRREGASGALAGMRLVVLDPAGSELPAGAQGELAIDTEKSPLFWFEGYFRNDEARRERFRFGRRYYCTGDLFRSDRAGGFRYLGPAADAITASGYVIGPVEVETALHAHAAVAEAAVIGQPDRLRGEIVKAFVVLKPGIAGSPELAHEIGGFARDRLADHPHPPEVEFVAALPRTGTGGLQRARLREGGQ
jgi:acetyl-CoA synthetase